MLILKNQKENKKRDKGQTAHAQGYLTFEGDAASYLGLDKMKGSKTYQYIFSPNHVSKQNAQNLTNRVDDMSSQGQNYWQGKSDSQGESLESSGVIIKN